MKPRRRRKLAVYAMLYHWMPKLEYSDDGVHWHSTRRRRAARYWQVTIRQRPAPGIYRGRK